jgi:hypothetical protein
MVAISVFLVGRKSLRALAHIKANEINYEVARGTDDGDHAATGAFALLTITTNTLMSLVIERFGLFGMQTHALSLGRMVRAVPDGRRGRARLDLLIHRCTRREIKGKYSVAEIECEKSCQYSALTALRSSRPALRTNV